MARESYVMPSALARKIQTCCSGGCKIFCITHEEAPSKSEDLTQAMRSFDPYVDHGGFCLCRHFANAGLCRWDDRWRHHKLASWCDYFDHCDDRYDRPLARSNVEAVKLAHLCEHS